MKRRRYAELEAASLSETGPHAACRKLRRIHPMSPGLGLSPPRRRQPSVMTRWWFSLLWGFSPTHPSDIPGARGARGPGPAPRATRAGKAQGSGHRRAGRLQAIGRTISPGGWPRALLGQASSRLKASLRLRALRLKALRLRALRRAGASPASRYSRDLHRCSRVLCWRP